VQLRAAQTYAPRTYHGRIVYFWTMDANLPSVTDPLRKWEQLAEMGLEVNCVGGNHVTALEEPNVGNLVQHLKACLHRARLAHQHESLNGSALIPEMP